MAKIKTIHKYSLFHGVHEDRFTLQLPAGAEILSASFDLKDEEPYLWAMIETTSPMKERIFEFIDTGKLVSRQPDFPNLIERKFIATFQFHDGYTIKHLFEHVYEKWRPLRN
jgi:hypothetical protein